MRIEVEVRNVYGQPKVYPVNEAAKLVAELVGVKTFGDRHIAILEKMGHEIVEVRAPRLGEVTKGPNPALRGNYPELNRKDGARYIGKDADGMAIYEGVQL